MICTVPHLCRTRCPTLARRYRRALLHCTAMTFSDLGLRPDLLTTVAELGYEAPSPIQAELIPVLLEGRDAIGQARTGTGKTASFALPILHALGAAVDAGAQLGQPRALVLAPTRELATQVSSAVYTYGKSLGVRALPITGGQPYSKQINRLRKGVDVVVATPGRLVDLINQGKIDLSAVKTVVLDEADEMLTMGFADDLDAIFDALPSERQTALLSATMAPGVRRLAARRLDNPETISVTDGDRTAADITQRGYMIDSRDKLASLVRLLETEDVTSALAFVKTRVGASQLAADLSRLGYAAEEISGDLSQAARTAVLDRFRRQQVRILCATDVAARGLDIDHVSHVFNVDLPLDPEAYVHRVGRTGRAGRKGVALSLVTPRDRGLLRRIEQAAGRRIEMATLPPAEAVAQLRAETLRGELEDALARISGTDRAAIDALVAEGHDATDLAAAAFGLVRQQRYPQPVAHIHQPTGKGSKRDRNTQRGGYSQRGGYTDNPRFERRDRGERQHGGFQGGSHRGGGFQGRAPREAHEAGFVRLAINAGREVGIRPGQVVSAIARTANIPGKALGKILVRDGHTLVDVPTGLADQVANTGTLWFGRNSAEIQRA